MCKHIIRILSFFVAFCYSFNNGFSQDSWKKKYEKSGISVYLRDSDKTPFKELMVETTVSATVSSVVFLIMDVNNHSNWMYANKGAKHLKDINDFEWIYYNISEAPWPVSNRDVVSKAKLIVSGQSVRLKVKGIPNYIPETKGNVRVQYINSFWDFIYISPKSTKVKLQMSVNLGGGIPPWLVNAVIDNGPYQTFLNMKEQLKKDKYKNAKLDFLEP